MDVAEPNLKSLPQLLVSNTSKPARLVIALLSFFKTQQKTHRPKNEKQLGLSPGEAGSDPICQSVPSSLFIDGQAGGRRGALMYSRRLPPRMSVFCLAAVTEKRHISTRSVSFHTHAPALKHTLCGRSDVLSRAENFPLSVFICW